MRDSFDPQPTPTPASPGPLEITLRVYEKADGSHGYEGFYSFTPEGADGRRIPSQHREGDLVPHLTAAQKSSLVSFLDAMYAKAEGAI